MLLSELIAGLVASIAQAQQQAHQTLLEQLSADAKQHHTIGHVTVPGVALTPAEVLVPAEVGLDTQVGVRASHQGLRVCRGSNLRIRIRYRSTGAPESVARLRVAAERDIDG